MAARQEETENPGAGRPTRTRPAAPAARTGLPALQRDAGNDAVTGWLHNPGPAAGPAVLGSAGIAALQRGAGNAAVNAVVQRSTGPTGDTPTVQRMYSGRSTRDSTRQQRNRDRTDPSGRTRSSRQQGATRHDLSWARRQPVPTRGENNERLWDGTRDRLSFWPQTTQNVLGRAYTRNARNGHQLFRCANCRQEVHQRAVADQLGLDNWVEIDHRTAILDYVNSNADGDTWAHDLGHGWYRQVSAITHDEAQALYNAESNLRAYCQHCNGGARAAASTSRHFDRVGANWMGDPFQDEGSEDEG
ncbi:hypothetical protein [Streptomyces sp. NPDC002588]|uniref:hypothetical protein n=1 Tax=Streptomyces sp. NPDC002588 TaxID=3154419 RepID=UPI0033260AFA